MSDSVEEDPRENILNEPLHGIVIPSALFIVGVIILTVMSGDYRVLFGLLILFAVVLVRWTSAYSRRRSLFTDRWTALELVDQTLISKNAAIYRFKLKTHLESLDIPAGHHVAVRIPIGGKDEIRFYNPINPKIDQGHLDIIVKSYQDGKVSKYFAGLQPGATVDFKGPIGIMNYAPNSSKEFGMVVAGSGITPALQILNEIVTVPEDLTKVSLIYANDTENDILLKDELDEMAEKYPYFQIHYVVRNPSEQWTGDTGVVTKEQLEKYLPVATDENRLMICGPEVMKDMVLRHAVALGWKHNVTNANSSNGDDQVFVF
ncbi:cytochrome-b5 reductase KNAG_0G03550 [Huiozyma naganishii CBS 8797]|uniref:FAD-binding FR-type domain-containing protein n=1 Tax=Huiozyma naganishii (strain ATCC MYA-139 / BCRC 22969 / CBS 8797 / KCTC 17520 / NBRC 10181 / NCYC 3082 / Yp74L-3) TaxID=1071383 RepID=J7S1D6_HUIN7|nr:hypothetical protein KNAG_0G03550 [Kazachstania naganishii CBS 8797]CCK71412.1 hypothetical protein KNAG_0G03550 [Kazachstania naganishii CBS 8797]